MSGNPFRRSYVSRIPDESSQSDALTSNSTAAKPKSKKKKRVVIQTPPHSPEEPSIPRRLSDGRTGSPPPAVTIKLDDEDTDSTTTADSDLEQALLNTRRNSGSLPPAPTTSLGAQSGLRAPYNPFAKTLATSEAPFGLQTSKTETGDEQAQAKPSASRAALDVDAFKNILLTGSATPSPPAAVQSQTQRPQDSSSSTDTSSLSRQSIFDPAHGAHPESPRTSMEYENQYPSEDDDDDENQDSSLLGPAASRPVEEGPPAPPKPKHGRAFPQMVSFADFDDSIPTGFSSSRPYTPPNNALLNGTMRPTLQRSPSDLNKPLPLPPAEQAGPATSALNEPREEPSQPVAASANTVAEAQPETKKAPPPPPPASRRHSTLPTRPRGSSNLSQGSAHGDDAPSPLQHPTEQSAKAAPAPPPSRRKQAPSHTPSPAVETPPQLPTPNEITADAKPAMPPPPPRRQSRTGSSANRTPSNASRHSITSSQPLIGGQVPPAPPPRRGAAGSKRSSMDGPPNSLATRRPSGTDYRRTSGQSFESERSVSIGSLQQVNEPGETANESAASSSAPVAAGELPRDILADMTAFQAEIDALRAAQNTGGG